MDQMDLHSIDADGAIAETRAVAHEAIDSGDTRIDFLRKGAVAGGAALEYLESTFYNEAAKHDVANGDKQLTAFLKTARTDENARVKFLKSALKRKHIPEPEFTFVVR